MWAGATPQDRTARCEEAQVAPLQALREVVPPELQAQVSRSSGRCCCCCARSSTSGWRAWTPRAAGAAAAETAHHPPSSASRTSRSSSGPSLRRPRARPGARPRRARAQQRTRRRNEQVLPVEGDVEHEGGRDVEQRVEAAVGTQPRDLAGGSEGDPDAALGVDGQVTGALRRVRGPGHGGPRRRGRRRDLARREVVDVEHVASRATGSSMPLGHRIPPARRRGSAPAAAGGTSHRSPGTGGSPAIGRSAGRRPARRRRRWSRGR